MKFVIFIEIFQKDLKITFKIKKNSKLIKQFQFYMIIEENKKVLINKNIKMKKMQKMLKY